MKYYNVTFKWYDTDTYCSNIAKAECAEDVSAHYAKYDSNPTISEASAREVEAAKERGKPIVTCPHIEAPAEVVEYISGDHKLTVEEVNGDTVRLSWFEMMGGRWVALGEPENWSKDAAAEEVESFKAGENEDGAGEGKKAPAQSEAEAEPEQIVEPYTITNNDQFGSVEISFCVKPSAEVRDALKALRFRWHGQRRVWYGYKDAETVRAAIESNTQPMTAHKDRSAKTTKPAAVNKYGVKVGDIFRATWGYEQTNNDFFQVVALVGESSVRVREVYLPMTDSDPVSPMSEDRTFAVVRDLLPPADRSVFIHDQENGDVKRLKSWAKDGKSDPQFKLTDYASAYFVSGDSIKVYESWYA